MGVGLEIMRLLVHSHYTDRNSGRRNWTKGKSIVLGLLLAVIPQATAAPSEAASYWHGQTMYMHLQCLLEDSGLLSLSYRQKWKTQRLRRYGGNHSPPVFFLSSRVWPWYWAKKANEDVQVGEWLLVCVCMYMKNTTTNERFCLYSFFFLYFTYYKYQSCLGGIPLYCI